MSSINWDADAEKELKKVPALLRKMVRRKIEERVLKGGADRVTTSDFKEAYDNFRRLRIGKSEKELTALMPADNRPGARMVILETCHAKLSGCPYEIIDTRDLREQVEDWLKNGEPSERLRKRVKGELILFHHKFRISISGCPNACSRPQIADVGLVGFVIPEVDPEFCSSCGLCKDACPDCAISVSDAPPIFDTEACLGCYRCKEACPEDCIKVSEPGVRVMLGGKLGRHPHLADNIGDIKSPGNLVSILDREIGHYLESAIPGERYSDFRLSARYWPESR